jgi:hypothetical protein
MDSKLMLSVLLVCGLSVCASATEAPPNSTLMKQCQSAKGEVKRECEEVAKEMLNKNSPPQERTDKTDQDVTHSSPAMTTPKEPKQEGEKKKPAPPPANPS